MNKFTKSVVMLVTLLLLTACGVNEEKEVMDTKEQIYQEAKSFYIYTVSLYVDVESNIYDLRNKYTTRYTIDAKYSYNDGSISRIDFSYY